MCHNTCVPSECKVTSIQLMDVPHVYLELPDQERPWHSRLDLPGATCGSLAFGAMDLVWPKGLAIVRCRSYGASFWLSGAVAWLAASPVASDTWLGALANSPSSRSLPQSASSVITVRV